MKLNKLGFQDASDFNVATSSLHALSNSMALTRSDRQSPHSSPRMTRRSTTTNANAQAALSQPSNDIYASQQQQQPMQQSQPQQQLQPNTKHTVLLQTDDNLHTTNRHIGCAYLFFFFFFFFLHRKISNRQQFKVKLSSSSSNHRHPNHSK